MTAHEKGFGVAMFLIAFLFGMAVGSNIIEEPDANTLAVKTCISLGGAPILSGYSAMITDCKVVR